MRHQLLRKRHSRKEGQADGFALPLVIILGSVVLLGSVSTFGKMLSGKLGSVRQTQATQAREIAQAGLAEVIESLNHDYPYQLINQYSASTEGDFGTWSIPACLSARCPGAVQSGHPATLADSSIHNGQYKVESYQFDGTRFHGGTGQLTITGERRNSDQKLLASATITTSFDIKPKNATLALASPPHPLASLGCLAGASTSAVTMCSAGSPAMCSASTAKSSAISGPTTTAWWVARNSWGHQCASGSNLPC